MQEVVKLLLSGLPDKIQCSNEKKGAYKLNIPKNIAIHNYKFIQFAHPKKYQWLSVDVDDRNQFSNIEDIVLFCKNNVIPIPTLIVETNKGFHIHWYMETPFWKNNSLLLKYRKELLIQLNAYFGGDKHSAGFIFRNPLKHKYVFFDLHYTFDDFKHIVSIDDIKNQYYTKKSIKKVAQFIDFTAVKVGERNNTLLKYIRTFTFRNIHLSFEQVLKEALRVNDLMIEPLSYNEVKATTLSAYNFAQKNYDENYKKNKYQAQYNRLLAKYKSKKTYIKGFKNLIEELKNDNISVLQFIWNKISFRKLAKLLKISDKTIKKHFKKFKKDLILYLEDKKLSFGEIEQIIIEEIFMLKEEITTIKEVKELGVLRC